VYVHMWKRVGERGDYVHMGKRIGERGGVRAHGEDVYACVCVCNGSNMKIVTIEDHRTIHLLFPGEDGRQRKTCPGCTS